MKHNPDMNAMMTEIRRINEEHGWNSAVPRDNPAVFCEKMLLVVSEISEALEAFRSLGNINFIYSEDDAAGVPKPEGVPIEIADAVIRILDFCAANNIDIVEAIYRKMLYNETRPYRHGGKVC